MAKRNPPKSESVGLSSIVALCQGILGKRPSPEVRRAVLHIQEHAVSLLEQVGRGIHENPPLAIIGNGPMGEVHQIEYKNLDDGKEYYHPFGRGAMIFTLRDGGFLIRSRTGKRLWKDFG